jgi:hypothetical protein
MIDNSTLLQRLVDLAEIALAMRPVSSESIADLRTLLSEAAARPCEGERFIGDEALLLGAHRRRRSPGDPVSPDRRRAAAGGARIMVARANGAPS